MKKENVTNDNYINIQGWMLKELNLKGNELLIFAIIYGFSQDGKSKFEGGLQYLADWTNSTKQGILKNLQSLLEKELIKKEEIQLAPNLKVCKYFCNLNLFNGIKQSLTPSGKQSLTNNNINIISQTNNDLNFSNKKIKNNDNLAKNIIKEKKLTKKQIKEQEEQTKINDLIDKFTDDSEIQELLEQYIDVRKQKGILTSAQLYIMLEDLKKECGLDKNYMIACLRKAIAGGWSQIVFIDKFKGMAKSSYSSVDNTASHKVGNPKISDLDFRFMTFEARKDYISHMDLADMTKDQREFFEKYCLARDENGNLLKF